MSGEEFRQEDVTGFIEKVEEVRKLLKSAESDVSEIAKKLEGAEEFLKEPPENAFEDLDAMHIKLKEAYDSVGKSYDEIKKKYAALRDIGIDIIEKHASEISGRKKELLDLGYKTDAAIKMFEDPEKILKMREHEVRLFNEIEDFYRSALFITTKIKDMDSRASLLGYEFAEFSGKLYGLNNMLIMISNSVEAGKDDSGRITPGRKPPPALSIERKKEKEFEHYIR